MNTMLTTRHPVRLAAILAALVAGALSASAWDSYDFDIPSGSKEALWRDALAGKVGGLTELKTKAGRVDVSTSTEVFGRHPWQEPV